MEQIRLPMISRTVEGRIINQRATDGYINATAMCTSVGKLFNDYYRLKSTTEFLLELAKETKTPVSELVQMVKGGLVEFQGTWVHPKVAIHLAQWLSAKFAVQVTNWVYEWMSGEKVAKPDLPHHIKRYMLNQERIPHTHFSILNELTFNLIAPLEQAGYTIPEHMVPDISEGRLFSKWLRDVKGIDTSTLPTYNHQYPDGRVYPARLYPNEVLADFRQHFHEEWLPRHAVRYFTQRDKNALKFVNIALLGQIEGDPADKLGPASPGVL